MNFRSDSEVQLRWYAPSNLDLEVVNAARVSFGKQKEIMDMSDIKLLNYLAEHKHMSPFRHPQLSFRIKTPEFVARQFYKHQIGCHYTSESSFKDHAWNEISGRYVVLEDEFYIPTELRKQSKSNKQASDGIFDFETNKHLLGQYSKSIEESFSTYQMLIEKGTAKELARNLLPVSFYTEFIWTTSLEAVIHLIKLRTHEGAQKEIQDVAMDIYNIVKPLAPHSMQALFGNINV